MNKLKTVTALYIMTALCDDCQVSLEDTGTSYCSYPPKFKYRCPECGKEYILNEEDRPGKLICEYE